MKIANYVEELTLDSAANVSVNGRMITVTGPNGSITRQIYLPVIKIEASKNIVTFKVPKYTMRERKMVGTFIAHIKNMVKGVTVGHTYKLKICTGHFPMNVTFTNGVFSIKNFIGEKVARTLKINNNVKVTIADTLITLESTDKELVGQTAATIEKLTKRPHFDRRVFQDGIYIIEKDGKVMG